MHTTVAIVNIPLAQILSLASVRTIYTIARHNAIPLSKQANKLQAVDIVAEALASESVETRAISRLNQQDIDILHTLCQHIIQQEEAGQDIIDLPSTIFISSQTHFPRALYSRQRQLPLDRLHPIERLMAFGFIIPVISPSPKTARILIHTSTAQAASHLHDALSAPPFQAPDKSPTLPLASIAGEAVTMLAVLSTQAAHHAPEDPLPRHIMRQLQARSTLSTLSLGKNLSPRSRTDALASLHTLLHQQGYLSLIDGRCLPTTLVSTLLAMSAEQMARSLLQQSSTADFMPPVPATLPAPILDRHTVIFPAQSPGALGYQLEAWTKPDVSRRDAANAPQHHTYACTFTHSSIVWRI